MRLPIPKAGLVEGKAARMAARPAETVGPAQDEHVQAAVIREQPIQGARKVASQFRFQVGNARQIQGVVKPAFEFPGARRRAGAAPRAAARINPADLEPPDEQQMAGGATACADRPLSGCDFIETHQFGSTCGIETPIVRTPAALELQQQGYVVLKNELTKGRCRHRALRSAAQSVRATPLHSHSSGPIFNGLAKGKRYHARDDSWAPGAERDLEKARLGSF
eukprot:6109343-Prymnesium_polylepis.3